MLIIVTPGASGLQPSLQSLYWADTRRESLDPDKLIKRWQTQSDVAFFESWVYLHSMECIVNSHDTSGWPTQPL